MLFTTPTEWIALLLTLLGGWLLGLASHPGGRKWRDRYTVERDAHAATRRDFEAKLSASEVRSRELEAEHGRFSQDRTRLADLERERESMAHERDALARADARVAELERENARLRQTATVPASAATAAPAAAYPTVAAAPTPTIPLTRRVVGGERRSGRGWFDWGPSTDPRARRG